jgi:hypothetical protein
MGEVTGAGRAVKLVNILSLVAVGALVWLLHRDWPPEKILSTCAVIWGFVSGAIVWLSLRRVERLPPKTITIEATGKQIEVSRSAGTFGYIPVKYYPYINPLMGLALAWLVTQHYFR